MTRLARAAATTVLTLVALGAAAAPAGAAVPTIAVDAAKNRGFVAPAAVGQMMEWALPEMNGAWAEKLADRSIEADDVGSLALRSPLYDAFTGSSLDRSRWTPGSCPTTSSAAATPASRSRRR